MSKNIIICCDGTGNEYGDRNSNVVKLFRALPRDAAQPAFYDPGVGTMSAPGAISWLAREWTLLIGLAFGYGISRSIANAYTYLMDRYEPGDSVFLFGFSRGAYTVRALAGLLHLCGLLRRGSENLIPYALKLYKRASPRREELCRGFKATFSRNCDPYFIGVWDTVSSVGWIFDPVRLPYTAYNSSFKVIRHAISVDERRCFFRQNLFSENDSSQNIKQVWFPGVHSDVGGGYAEHESGLSKIPLAWMAREAVHAGLLLNNAELQRILGKGEEGIGHENFVQANPSAKMHNPLLPCWWILEFFPRRHSEPHDGHWVTRWIIPLFRRRWIRAEATLHQSVLDRKKDSTCHYNPTNLPENFMVEP